MKILLSILALVAPIISLSQAIIWSEDFESYTNGTQNAVKWTTSAGNCDSDGTPGTSGDNYWGTRTTLGDKEFCCEDIEGLTCCGNSQGASDNLWISQAINIAGYTDISISIDMRAEGDMECDACGQGRDLFNAEYQIDGGTWVSFLSVCGLNNGQSIIQCVDVGTGSSLRIRVRLGNQADTEEYYFDDVIVYDATCSVVLPIELLSFTGEYISETGENALEWITVSERNNDYFTLEHSTDGISWNTISKIPGAGNSTTQIHYRETHGAPEGISYYRLSQTDYDGKSKSFNIVSISSELETPKYVKYYNLMGQEINPSNISGLVIAEYHFNSGKVERLRLFFSL